jgi:hypothetical protein
MVQNSAPARWRGLRRILSGKVRHRFSKRDDPRRLVTKL